VAVAARRDHLHLSVHRVREARQLLARPRHRAGEPAHKERVQLIHLAPAPRLHAHARARASPRRGGLQHRVARALLPGRPGAVSPDQAENLREGRGVSD
jgi:hypothetical protein